MICKYCGHETTAENGICKACSYKLKVDPNREGIDIFSNSGDEKRSFERFEPRKSSVETLPQTEEVRGADFAPVKSQKRLLRKGFVAVLSAAVVLIIVILLHFHHVI